MLLRFIAKLLLFFLGLIWVFSSNCRCLQISPVGNVCVACPSLPSLRGPAVFWWHKVYFGWNLKVGPGLCRRVFYRLQWWGFCLSLCVPNSPKKASFGLRFSTLVKCVLLSTFFSTLAWILTRCHPVRLFLSKKFCFVLPSGRNYLLFIYLRT